MAVPPKGIQVIFESVLKSFAKIDYDHIPASILESSLNQLDII